MAARAGFTSQGNLAYKIYLDPARMIPEAKIAELARLDRPNIICPRDVLLDKQNTAIGFSMNRVDGLELCRLFNTVFLRSNNITPELLLKLVENMQETTQFIHDRGFLVVDGNELNYLVDQQDYSLPYFIDVNSYQTPAFPASAINVLFQDPQAKHFSRLSDWYSFGIVICKLFVGIHPFRGSHPNYKKRDVLQRMKDHVSIFNAESSVPAAARDFSYIPSAYYDWLVNMFEKGERVPPPHVAGLLKVVQVTAEFVQSSGNVAFKLLRKYDQDILRHKAVHGKHIVLTKEALHIDHDCHRLRQFSGEVVFSPKSAMPLLLNRREKDGILEISEMGGTVLDLQLKTERPPMALNNRIYSFYQGDLTEIVIHEMNGRPIASVANVWKIMPKSSMLFDGLIYQTVLGKSYLVIPYQEANKGYCAMQRIPELDDYKIVDGKHENHVCMLIGVKDGLYHRLILRFDARYQQYDLRVVEDIEYPQINFVSLENGIAVSLDEHATIEVFSNAPGTSKVKQIDDPAVRGDMLLSKDGANVLCYSGKKLYSLKMV